MADTWQIITGILGVLGFIISLFIAYIQIKQYYIKKKEYEESNSQIEISNSFWSNGQLVKRNESNQQNVGLRIQSMTIAKKRFIMNVGYTLKNNSDKVLTVCDIEYFWNDPLFEKTTELQNYDRRLYQFNSKRFGNGLWPPSECNIKISPGAIKTIKDAISASEYVNTYLEKNYLKWKKEHSELTQLTIFEGLPPKYTFSIEIIDNKNRKSISTRTIHLWGSKKTLN
jgi:hypothetical protein